jgi:hypothetical protein
MYQLNANRRLTPVANLPPVSPIPEELVAKFAAGVVDTGNKFATGVVDTSGKFATGVVDTGGAPLFANISANFRKIQNDPNIIFREHRT